MNISIEQIKKNSTKLKILNGRIHTTFKDRDKSKEHKEKWKHACNEFHQHFNELSFPGGYTILDLVRKNEPKALEAAINYLLADPYHFRSGYIKEYLWKWLQHCDLKQSAYSKLEQAALMYLERPVSREFWNMCKAMSRLARSGFWVLVSQKANDTNNNVATRAVWLLTHGASIHAGSRIRRNVYSAWILQKYG